MLLKPRIQRSATSEVAEQAEDPGGAGLGVEIGLREGSTPQFPSEIQKLKVRGVDLECILLPPWTVVDLHSDEAFHHLFYREPERAEVLSFGRFLRNNPQAMLRLFHGTLAAHPVLEEGLLPSSAKRAKSLQSAPGFVCLSVYPGMAEDFARIAYPGKPIQVYAAEIMVQGLKADLDQMKNRRYWGEERYANLGNTLAESLIFGRGARVRGAVQGVKIWNQDGGGKDLG